MKKLLTELGFPTADDLLASVGYGKTSVQQVLGKLAPVGRPRGRQRPRAEAAEGWPKKPEGAVRISGVDDLLVRFAKCCSPGARATASWASSPGAAASRCTRATASRSSRTCSTRSASSPWSGTAAEPTKRPVRIAVYIGQDRPGLLAEITGAISSRHGNITKAEVTVTDDRKGLNHFVVEVDDLRQLQEIMQAIREVKDVINVERVRDQ